MAGRDRALVFAAVVLAFFVSAISVPARAAGLLVEDIRLPAKFATIFGQQDVSLEGLIVRPDDQARHPLVVITHGTPRVGSERADRHARNMHWLASEFARRGFTAVVVVRRGFGSSEGMFLEGNGPCAHPDYSASGRTSAEDIRETIRIMRDHPAVDASRIVSIGQSAGGLATVALTADPPPGLVAAISFAGGRGSAAPDQVCQPRVLIDAFAEFGKTSRIPMLWIYAENDHYFSPDLARLFHAAFTAGGGQADLVVAPSFGSDGHHLFSMAGEPIWGPPVDAFLTHFGLMSSDEMPPMDLGVTFPPGLSARGKLVFLDYLDGPPHKAFVLSPEGAYGYRTGAPSEEDAVGTAMSRCREAGRSRHCRPVMIGDGPAPATGDP